MHKKIHFIGIDETVMVDLAIALRKQGYIVTDNKEKEKPKENIASSLSTQNVLPRQYGFSEDNLDDPIEYIIIGREIDTDNIEFRAAKELDLPIYSYTEYIYHYAKDKQRIVVTGEPKARAMVLSMVIYVMNYWGRSFDYVTSIPALNTAVKLSGAPIIFLEADTYSISAVDQRIQSLVYKPHIVLISSIDMEYCKTDILSRKYIDMLSNLSNTIPKAGSLLYNANIPSIKEILAKPQIDVKYVPYQEHEYKKIDNVNYLLTPQRKIPISSTDKLVLESISATYYLLKELAITKSQFYEAIADFVVEYNASSC